MADGTAHALVDAVTRPGKLNAGPDRGRDVDAGGEGYAFGLRVGSYRDRRYQRHGGSWAGYRSFMLRYPDQRVTVILLSNASTSLADKGWVIARRVLEDRD